MHWWPDLSHLRKTVGRLSRPCPRQKPNTKIAETSVRLSWCLKINWRNLHFLGKLRWEIKAYFLQVSQLFPLLSKRGMAWMVACRYFTAHALKQRWSVSCYRQGSETLKHGRFHRWAVLPLTHRVGENGPAWKKSWKHIIAISLVTVSAVSSLTNATQLYNKPYPPGNAYRKTYNSLGRCHGKNNLGFVNEGRGTI